VNVVSSFILGVFSVFSQQFNLDEKYALFIAMGFCGSFTTMSSLALETSSLDNKHYSLVAFNILANIDLALWAVFGGKVLTAWILDSLLR
jgi:CrcB protein